MSQLYLARCKAESYIALYSICLVKLKKPSQKETKQPDVLRPTQKIAKFGGNETRSADRAWEVGGNENL